MRPVAGSRESVAANREPGTGNREPGASSREEVKAVPARRGSGKTVAMAGVREVRGVRGHSGVPQNRRKSFSISEFGIRIADCPGPPRRIENHNVCCNQCLSMFICGWAKKTSKK